MKQVVFISGKGGTGKSTVVASLSLLAKNKIMADCDVDAPNLHILLKGRPFTDQRLPRRRASYYRFHALYIM